MTANSTSFDSSDCTYTTCSIEEYGQLAYIPSLAGNAFYLALFSIALLTQVFLSVSYRTWGFMIAMVAGCSLEVLGYVARIQLHFDVFDEDHFILYLVGLTIGPAFFSGAIYLCLARIIAVYGTSVSLFSPRRITILFMSCDFVSLVLQAAGGAMTSLNEDNGLHQTGINVMIAGLASQVASTIVFCLVCGQIMFTVSKRPELVNNNGTTLRRATKFQVFLRAIGIATITILIRCCFRVAELSKGFGSTIANDQVLFMVLDGTMMAIAVLALSIGHPGPALGSMWADGNFRLFAASSKVETETGWQSA